VCAEHDEKEGAMAQRAKLVGMLSACTLLSACTDEYSGIITKAVIDAGGVDQAKLVLLEKANRGNGRDLYIYSLFLNKYASETQDAAAFFNCAVSAGFQDAIDNARDLLRYKNSPEATAALTCFDQKRNSRITWDSKSWTTCGIEKFFPACPLTSPA
jgi:hypothetical protein